MRWAVIVSQKLSERDCLRKRGSENESVGGSGKIVEQLLRGKESKTLSELKVTEGGAVTDREERRACRSQAAVVVEPVI